MKILSVLFLFLVSVEIHAQNDTDPCNIYELVVVLDQSRSVSEDFSVACLEVADFFQSLSIDSHAAHAGLVTFNTYPFVIHIISGEKASLVQSTKIISEDTASGTTNLSSALGVTFDLFQESERWQHSEVVKICIVITDGHPTESVDPVLRLEGNSFAYPSLLYAQLMKDSGIVFYTISMGSSKDYSREYLERLASSPDHFFFAKYTELSRVLSKINLCQ